MTVNKIVALLVLTIISLSVFPVNYTSPKPVACDIAVYTDTRVADLVKIVDQDFESFFNEKKYVSRSSGLAITKQSMGNGDLLVWFRVEHNSPKSFIDMDFTVGQISGPIRYWKHEDYMDRSEYAGDNINSRYRLSQVGGVSAKHDKGPALFEFGANKPSIFISRTGRFRPCPVGLLKSVDCKQDANIIFGNNSIKIRIFLEPTTSEFEEGFVLVSNSRLLDLENQRNHTFLVSHDLWRVKPLLSDGWWLSAQSGFFEGADGDCYYPNPGFYAAKSMLMWYCQLDNRFFYDIVLTNMKMAYEKARMEGFARMPIMPVYFTGMYGGFIDYVDTRFSTDGVRFLIKCAKLLDSQKARLVIPELARYYADNFDDISIDIDGDGSYLISDYIFDSTTKPKVHASLNHTLCIINYLLEYEDVTGDKSCSWVVDKLVESLNKTSTKWAKPNGDLWYGYFPTVNGFSNDDYSFLTNNDLIECARLLERVRKASSPGIMELLKTKRNYLEAQGLIKKKQPSVLKGFKESDAMIINGSSISH
ncbi:MAG: hypothetical protein KA140_05390 [Caldisericia bacterium]|nr:hypothetical protein [Caldisericia bacterium]